jgi:molecular chaperone HtpG
MSAYREGPRRPRAHVEPKTGLVNDMVRQFADPYAFLRELVQNSMDAGTTRVEVSLSRDMSGRVKTTVSDDGSGMTPAVMEGSLLTLFSSSKEGDTSKIGKYGVGFVSVLALEPLEVTVESWCTEGAWRLRLNPDQQYAIEEMDRRAASGTAVSLLFEMDSTSFDDHASHCRHSLERWCRHAHVPIFVSVTDYGNPGASLRIRCDRPLGVFAATSVTDVSDDSTIVLGPAAGSEFLAPPEGLAPNELSPTFAGFYNRGLTLYETTQERFKGLEGLRFKVESSKLEHTLSRDNVRRERDFDRLLERARDLAKRSLPEAVERALAEQARAVAGGAEPASYLALLCAAALSPLSLGKKRILFPLADPLEGKSALSASELSKLTPWRKAVVTSTESNELTREFARAGRPVVLSAHPAIRKTLGALVGDGGTVRAEPIASRHFVLNELEETELGASDQALASELERLLIRAGRPVQKVRFADARGADLGLLVAATEPPSGVFEMERAIAASRRWGKQSTLLLDTRHQAVRAARGRARANLREVAHLLVRLLLLERAGPIGVRANDALLRDYAEGGP